MRLSFVAAMAAVLLTPAVGAAPAGTAELIDHYRGAPRAPGTYRALAGMGDPDRARLRSGDFPLSDDERDLLARMLPRRTADRGQFWYPEQGRCRTDYALSVARARIARFGTTHPYVEQWMRAQRAVFSACRDQRPWGPQPGPRRAGSVTLPPPMPTGDAEIAALQRDDRAYQAAALLFYLGDPGARRAFRAIAGSSSPHAPVARYMMAALHISEEDFYGSDRDAAELERRSRAAQAALAEAQAILADPRLREAHPLAQGLIGFLGYHTGDPRIRAAQVDALLDALEAPIARIETDAAAADRYARAIADIDHIDPQLDEGAAWPSAAMPERMTAGRALVAAAGERPLAAWLLYPQSPFERMSWISADRAVNLPWQAAQRAASLADEPAGYPWRVLLASFSLTYDPQRWEEIEALQAATLADPSEPRVAAIATLLYHQVRTALMYPLYDENYRQLREPGFDAALARVAAWPWKDSVHYRELVSDMLQYLVATGRLREARQLRDRLSPRGEGFETALALLLLAEDEAGLAREIAAAPERGQYLLNLLSVDALAGLAAREELPQTVRARFARVAWSRLYALQRPIPRALDLLMRHLNPEIVTGWRSRAGARTLDRRLLLDVLRSPALNILIVPHQRQADETRFWEPVGLTEIDTFEHSDNNWWCAWQPDRHALRASAAMFDALFAGESRWDRDPLAVAGVPAALGPLLRSSWLWNAQDPAEQAALAAIPSAPQLLAERAVAWRGGRLFRRSEPGQDEALALAVRATRYGCQRQGGHGRWSRAAYTLLQARFPGTAAAARTRYWFDCSHFTGGCSRPRQEEAVDWRRWTDATYD